jgi:hypothetical protein
MYGEGETSDEVSCLEILLAPSPTPPTRATNQGGDGPPVGVASLWIDGPCVKVIRA